MRWTRRRAVLPCLLLFTACNDDEAPRVELPQAPQLLPRFETRDGDVLVPLTAAASARSFTLAFANGGREDLLFSAIDLDGADAAAFTIEEITPASQRVASGETLSVHITVQPTGRGVFFADLTLASNAENAPTLTVPFVAPASTAPTPAAADIAAFGVALESAAGAEVVGRVQYFNLGAAPLYVTDYALVNDAGGVFQLHADSSGVGLACTDAEACGADLECRGGTCLPAPLLAGERGVVKVRFVPAASGSFAGQLLLGSSDPDAPEVVVSLGGSRP